MSEKRFLIGTYAEAGQNSLWEACLDEAACALSAKPLSSELRNPSWIALHPDGQTLYAVEELEPKGAFAALKMRNGVWRTVERLEAGSAPCHICLDRRAEFAFVSNYMDGTLSVYRLGPDGLPKEQSDLIRHNGHGVNPERQEGPHIHSTLLLPGDETICCCDLGLDEVSVCSLNRGSGKLQQVRVMKLPDGAGPRHMARHPRHPDLLYVDAELGGQVFVISLRSGEAIQSVSAIPKDYTADFRVSSIRFTGDTLYVGARECNTVSLFRLRPDGLLDAPTIYRHSQETPRDVWMDDSWCITADEGSFGLTLLRREGDTLRQLSFTPTPGAKPTCILPV